MNAVSLLLWKAGDHADGIDISVDICCNFLLLQILISLLFAPQNFLRDLLREAKKSQEVSEDELIQYTDTMLQVFDSNKDGKLQLSEMAK